MSEETKKTEVVEEVEQEEVDTRESTEQQQDEVVSKQVMKDRLDRKEKQHQKEVGELQDTIETIRQELEEIKTQNMPPEEAKSYKQQKAEEEEKQRIADLEAREEALQLRENTLAVQSALSEKNINTDFVHILLDTGKYTTLEDKLEAFSDLYIENLEENTKKSVKEALTGKSPNFNGTTNKALTKEQIMDIEDSSERLKAIRENPHLFK